jgi:hypothetical protein
MYICLSAQDEVIFASSVSRPLWLGNDAADYSEFGDTVSIFIETE